MRVSVISGFLAAVAGLWFASCDEAKEAAIPSNAVLSASEMLQHSSPTSCWMSISGTVYDLTEYLSDHPGGENVLLPYCGTDATEKYKSVNHSSAASTALSNLTKKGTYTGTSSSAATHSLAEVATHNTADNCWVTIGTRIYNVSDYFAEAQTTNNTPFVHKGGTASTDNAVTLAKNAAHRKVIAASVCGKDVSYYLGVPTTIANTIGAYTYNVASGQACPSYSATGTYSDGTTIKLANTASSGTYAGTGGACSSGGVCSSGPCILQVIGGEYKTIATGETCPSYSASINITSGSTALAGVSIKTSGTCASSTCTDSCNIQVTGGTSKAHTSNAYRLFLEKYYFGDVAS
jgi:cytochrome b involved in lipid metabolism